MANPAFVQMAGPQQPSQTYDLEDKATYAKLQLRSKLHVQ